MSTNTHGGARKGAGRHRKPEAERKVQWALRLPPELAEDVEKEAALRGVSKTAVMVDWMRRGMQA